ncbi:hypothetical protein G7085_12555 [Tessaracoccus sp. HDW20]|uniref:hypothetical protein n=1 Tax=Tessaracoccus coleopterorum TaxID=2714950 RepID=UPI0018D4A215|nr:hypothetical protein [Tessaracoccus coleopterorum]NHB85172.1 hypothetical protein [Tessaracoccus coleopterorum]
MLHAHNPLVLPVAWAAAKELRGNGHVVKLSYDVREDFAGLPPRRSAIPPPTRPCSAPSGRSCPTPTT